MKKETPIYLYFSTSSLVRYVQEILNKEGYFNLDILGSEEEVLNELNKTKNALLISEIDLLKQHQLIKKIKNPLIALLDPNYHLNLETLVMFELKDLVQLPLHREKIVAKLKEI